MAHAEKGVAMTKILVTGAAGFIGFHLSKRLLARGDEVVGLDNLNDYYDVNLKLARLKQITLNPTSGPCASILRTERGLSAFLPRSSSMLS